MSRVLTFWVEGRPVPKERARTVRKPGRKPFTYTPKRTVDWERRIRALAMRACAEVCWKPEPVAHAIDLTVHRARRAGDADNFGKSCLDACNGVIWPDDRHLMQVTVRLVDGQGQGMQVRVTRLEAST